MIKKFQVSFCSTFYYNRSIEFDEFLEFIIARQGDGRDVHNEIVQVSAHDYKFKYLFRKIVFKSVKFTLILLQSFTDPEHVVKNENVY